jgi:hypothetical protein
VDRNKSGKIETSSDVNNDGIITTDCDDNNLPDDGATKCVAGKAHEFYGLDDECILFTTNTGPGDQYGRPLALGQGPGQPRAAGPADAWAGTFQDGVFYRISGKTGLIVTTVQIKPQGGVNPKPYGAAVDRFGILWAANENPDGNTYHLFYFDTNNPTNQGMVVSPWPGGFYGIAIDGYKVANPDGGPAVEIQQVWLGNVSGAGAFRYRPVRDKGFAGLSQGTWAYADFKGMSPRGRGIGVDNRTPKAFAWVALDGYAPGAGPAGIGRIPTDIPDGVITPFAVSDVMLIGTAGGQHTTTGAGVAVDLDIWGVNQTSSSAIHFKVDAMGKQVGQPDVIPLDDKPSAPETFCGQSNCKPHPYTYSDFTGFGLRNFTNPHGVYRWVQSGCTKGKTRWLHVYWDAATPAGTKIAVAARAADTQAALAAATWTGAYTTSPADLAKAPGPLKPNPADMLQVEFDFTTTTDVSPKLKSFQITYECVTDGPS